MKFHVLTLFPEMVEQAMSYSIIGRGQKEGLIEINPVNIRDFSKDKHKKVDDYPYGGGCGMVMQPEPIYNGYKSLNAPKGTRVIYMTPQGKPFSQEIAKELATEETLILLCGHYEGVDERIIEEIVTDEISIGDFVLTGGELAAMAVIDAVARLKSGVLNKEESFEEETFTDGTLEYPQYTRPPVFLDKEVPSILLSGHHENVDKWRREQSLIRTALKRPDLFSKLELSEKEKIWITQYIANRHQNRLKE